MAVQQAILPGPFASPIENLSIPKILHSLEDFTTPRGMLWRSYLWCQSVSSDWSGSEYHCDCACDISPPYYTPSRQAESTHLYRRESSANDFEDYCSRQASIQFVYELT
jgi:hypothetical protein